MFENFTDRARKVMALANQEAKRLNHEYIGTGHILLGLVKEGGGVAAHILKNLDVDLRKVQLQIEKLIKVGPETVAMSKLPQTPRAKQVIEYAIEEFHNLKHEHVGTEFVGTEHLLLGLLREPDGVAAQVLMNLNLRLEDVRAEVLDLFGFADDEARPATRQSTRPRESSESEGTRPLTLLLDPGNASREDIAELFVELSTLYRMIGGSGITFRIVDTREPVVA
jgi:ATP-dependent Clp protease ATP-binding subunit ClpC